MSAFYDNLATTFGAEKTMEIAMEAAAWIEKKKNEAQLAKLFTEPPVEYGPNQIWSASDCRSHNDDGWWMRTATEQGCYGMGIAPKSRGPNANAMIDLESGEQAEVSKKCYKMAMKVKKGDTLLTADKFRGIVFQGTVLEDAVGPFRSSSFPNSFKQQVRARIEKETGRPISPRRLYPVETDVEVFLPKVTWKEVGPITPEWNAYLHADHIRGALMKLTTPPPF